MASIVGRILAEVSGMGSPDMWTEYHKNMGDEGRREELTAAATLFVIETQNVKHQIKLNDDPRE